jgi:hypothetical protein
MMIKTTLLVLAALTAAPACAQSVGECDWRAEAASLAEPWEDHTRTFANGDIRIALIDVGEPAAGGFHLLVLSPPYGELGERQCRVVTTEDGIGFPGLKVDQTEAVYDPATGLTLRVPLARYDLNSGSVYDGSVLAVTVNQSTGDILTGIE